LLGWSSSFAVLAFASIVVLSNSSPRDGLVAFAKTRTAPNAIPEEHRKTLETPAGGTYWLSYVQGAESVLLEHLQKAEDDSYQSLRIRVKEPIISAELMDLGDRVLLTLLCQRENERATIITTSVTLDPELDARTELVIPLPEHHFVRDCRAALAKRPSVVVLARSDKHDDVGRVIYVDLLSDDGRVCWFDYPIELTDQFVLDALARERDLGDSIGSLLCMQCKSDPGEPDETPHTCPMDLAKRAAELGLDGKTDWNRIPGLRLVYAGCSRLPETAAKQ
jgi:hypothetical protein